MGLEGVEYAERMEAFGQLSPPVCDNGGMFCGPMPMVAGMTASCGFSCLSSQNQDAARTSFEGTQLQILMQAQALLKKSELYQNIDGALRGLHNFRPCIQNLPQTAVDDKITCWHRDGAVNNLRFLNIFYGYGPSCFALAVNLLDTVLSKVKSHPRYLSCIAMGCFYIAIKAQRQLQPGTKVPTTAELVKLSQCGGSQGDLERMEMRILDLLQGHLPSITALTFLNYFADVLASKQSRLDDPALRNVIIAKLEVLMCQFEFAKYRAETLALALLSCVLQDMDLLGDMDLFTTVVELQYFCQINDYEFLQCRGLIMDFLVVYCSQRARVPRLNLVWTVSRRTLSKMKPSTRILLDLEPIMEDEADEDEEEDESDDAGPFDSENETESSSKLLLQPNYSVRSSAHQNAAAGAIRSSAHHAVVASAAASRMAATPSTNLVTRDLSAMPGSGGSSRDAACTSLDATCSELSFITLHSKESNNNSNM